MTMLKWSLAAVAAVAVIFLVGVALQPADFRIERSATIRAPAIAPFTDSRPGVNMDSMVGGMFEQGLAQMKSVVETQR